MEVESWRMSPTNNVPPNEMQRVQWNLSYALFWFGAFLDTANTLIMPKLYHRFPDRTSHHSKDRARHLWWNQHSHGQITRIENGYQWHRRRCQYSSPGLLSSIVDPHHENAERVTSTINLRPKNESSTLKTYWFPILLAPIHANEYPAQLKWNKITTKLEY